MPPPRNDNPRRKNGFATPYTGAQISTWIALPVLIVEFLLVVAPVLPLAASIPCTIVFSLTAVLSAYYAFLAQYIDPMDEHLAKHLKKEENSESEISAANNNGGGFGNCLGGVNDEVEPLKHCWICETQVAEHAMHCKFCNKCIGNFDHHCLWLNTCVGKANYHYFFLTMIYITVMLVVHCSIQIALIIDIFLDGPSKQSARDWFETGSPATIVGIYIGFVVFDLISLSLILQLLYFHLQLRREGLTTYRYIVRETQRKREKTNQEEARKNQRMVAMGKANDEGNTLLALRLRLGGKCQCCDPLPPLEVAEKEQQKQDELNNNPQPDSPSSTSNGAADSAPQPPPVEADIENGDSQEEEDVATSNGVNSEETDVNENENSNGEVKFVSVSNGTGKP